jgi:hypothetical protein
MYCHALACFPQRVEVASFTSLISWSIRQLHCLDAVHLSISCKLVWWLAAIDSPRCSLQQLVWATYRGCGGLRQRNVHADPASRHGLYEDRKQAILG